MKIKFWNKTLHCNEAEYDLYKLLILSPVYSIEEKYQNTRKLIHTRL